MERLSERGLLASRNRCPRLELPLPCSPLASNPNRRRTAACGPAHIRLGGGIIAGIRLCARSLRSRNIVGDRHLKHPPTPFASLPCVPAPGLSGHVDEPTGGGRAGLHMVKRQEHRDRHALSDNTFFAALRVAVHASTSRSGTIQSRQLLEPSAAEVVCQCARRPTRTVG